MELEKFKQIYVVPNLPHTRKEWIWFIIIILFVITSGIIAVNQYLAISYKATLILNPCDLCKDYIQQINSPIDISAFKNLTLIP